LVNLPIGNYSNLHLKPFILFTANQTRFLVHQYANGTLLRIEPVKMARDSIEYECLAENGVGDAVTATATLTVYEGKPMNFAPVFPLINIISQVRGVLKTLLILQAFMSARVGIALII
jgi:hypothetical protein